MAHHPITLTVSPGRSGTTFLYATFGQNYPTGCTIEHEFLHPMAAKPAVYHRSYDDVRKQQVLAEPIVRKTLALWQEKARTGPVIDFGWTMAPLVPAFHDVLGDQLRVLVVHRHPIAVAASLATMGFYKQYEHANYTWTPMLPGARFSRFAEQWQKMSGFEKCLFRWMETTAYGLELPAQIPGLHWLTVSFEEFIRSDNALRAIADFIGLPQLDAPARADTRNPIGKHHNERFPLRDDWRSYQQYPELLDLAQNLGYDMAESNVESMVRKYQTSPGVLPFVRYLTNFWGLKARVGTLLRSLGLREQYSGVDKMERQLKGQL